MKPSKTSKQLPLRSEMLKLAGKDSSILDYAKASPIVPDEPQPTVLQTLRKQKGLA